MQRIGCVLHISSSGNAVVKAERVPRIGDKVVDEKMEPIGRVFDIFGSVSSPYVSVKTSIKDSSCLVDSVLYSVPSRKSSRKRR